ncbi:Protein of unknown function (DUF3240) [Thiorhodovibrio frisius]|uniref:DUF3240 domain-containing protein n=1 Tax=Thiorhodovibrio frisius TaxID=631362 RepID=H8Z368_9GAMM|nr:Protein of unknown function (DUF3240) [Thiorhodovibrio frisius]WPL21743.1 hypothetical protein Thiofri_01876 [Thiorhodovibrio frisius]
MEPTDYGNIHNRYITLWKAKAVNSNALLSLIVAPEAEEAVAAWLLDDETIPGFSSTPIAGHGSSESSMTLAEQVAGRRRRVMFFTHLEQSVAERVLERLREDFPGADIHYWIAPVLVAGHLG